MPVTSAGNETADLPEDGADRRTAARVCMLLLATIKYDDMLPSATSRVLDLSSGGIRTTLPVPLERGHPVSVTMKGVGEVRGRIAWTHGSEVGIKFDQRISTAVVVQALTGLPAATHIDFPKKAAPRPGFKIR